MPEAGRRKCAVSKWCCCSRNDQIQIKRHNLTNTGVTVGISLLSCLEAALCVVDVVRPPYCIFSLPVSSNWCYIIATSPFDSWTPKTYSLRNFDAILSASWDIGLLNVEAARFPASGIGRAVIKINYWKAWLRKHGCCRRNCVSISSRSRVRPGGISTPPPSRC